MSEENKNQSVHKIAPVEVYLVKYTDGAGKDSTCLAFQAKGSKSVTVLSERIAGTFVATPSTDWFSREFNRARESQKPVESV